MNTATNVSIRQREGRRAPEPPIEDLEEFLVTGYPYEATGCQRRGRVRALEALRLGGLCCTEDMILVRVLRTPYLGGDDVVCWSAGLVGGDASNHPTPSPPRPPGLRGLIRDISTYLIYYLLFILIRGVEGPHLTLVSPQPALPPAEPRACVHAHVCTHVRKTISID